MKATAIALLAAAFAPLAARAASHDLATFVLEYDLDGDGVATKEEFQRERERRFAATDVDHDGGISRDEYVDEFRARLMFSKPDADTVKRQIEQTHVRFDVLDTNDDGAISAAEFHHSGWGMFDEHDYNRDGAVSLADEADAGGRRS
jgi:Ca2+-binding EF-hand superfamily protein